MTISRPLDHQYITIIPISIIYSNTISPRPYSTHTAVNISPSFPSLISTATPYHHDHIPPTRPSWYHHHPHLYHIQQHHITKTISHPHDHQYITTIPTPIIYSNTISPGPYPTHTTINISPSSPSLSSTATPYHHDHIPLTRPLIYHHHSHPYYLQKHHITMTISHPHDHQYITIIPISIIYSNTISPRPHPTHTAVNISPSFPSLLSTETPYHHDHIPPTRPSIYHHYPHLYHLQQHHITTTISHSHDR